MSQPTQNIAAPLPEGLKRFTVASTLGVCKPLSIVATTAERAWAKFTVQRFGVLKPSRGDWTVEPAAE